MYVNILCVCTLNKWEISKRVFKKLFFWIYTDYLSLKTLIPFYNIHALFFIVIVKSVKKLELVMSAVSAMLVQTKN